MITNTRQTQTLRKVERQETARSRSFGALSRPALAPTVPFNSPRPVSEDPKAFSRTVHLGGIALIFLALGVQAFVLWSHDYAPLLDLPNHMARHHLEYRALCGVDLPPDYEIHYGLLPNLGADLVVPALLTLFDPLTACKVFLTLSVVLFWLGPAVFIWQYGGFKPAAFVAALFLLPWTFNSHFFLGFLNFHSGIGLAFLTLAHFRRLQQKSALRPGSLILHTALVTLLFFWHLAAWGTYCILAGFSWLEDMVASGRLVRCHPVRLVRPLTCALVVVPSLALFACYTMSHREPGPLYLDWGTVSRKAILLLTFFRGCNRTVDGIVLVLWLAAGICAFGVPLPQRVRWGWLPLGCAVLLALTFALPCDLGSTSDADSRPLPGLIIGALALLGRFPLRRVLPGLVLLALGVALRFGSIERAWDRQCARCAAQAQAFTRLEPRCRVLPIVIVPSGQFARHPEWHFAAWAVVWKEAFIPTLFAYRDQQPLRLRSAERPSVRHRSNCYEIDEAAAASYDYAWVCSLERANVRVPRRWQRVLSSGSFTLWRVRATSAAKGPAARSWASWGYRNRE
jgi:hypothetical protein